MNTMDNTKVIQALEKYTLYKYLENLIHAKLHKTTLFGIFAHTGAPNLSAPRYFILIDDLSKIIALNSGCFLN